MAIGTTSSRRRPWDPEPIATSSLAFAWSGFVVGVAGAMYTALIGHVTAEASNLLELILHFAVVMVGGLGEPAGPCDRRHRYSPTPGAVPAIPVCRSFVLSFVIIGVLLFLPRGREPARPSLVRLHERYYRE